MTTLVSIFRQIIWGQTLTQLSPFLVYINGLLPKHVLPARYSDRGWKAAPTEKDAKETFFSIVTQ